MKKIVLASVAALTFATPSFAAGFSGPRVAAVVGFAGDDFLSTEAFTYGINAGYDVDLGTTVIGATVEYQDSDEDGFGRDLSIVGRYGFKINEQALVYGTVGYTNQSVEGVDIELDGVRAGLGVELPFGPNAYGQIETRYNNYQYDLESYQTVLGVGFRF